MNHFVNLLLLTVSQTCVEYRMPMLTITHLIIRSSLCINRAIILTLYVAVGAI